MWFHLVTKRIRPSGNHTNVTFPRALVVACAVQGIELNVRGQIISEWKIFYRGNNKALFLPGLIIALCKQEEVPLLNTDEAAAKSDEGGDDTCPTGSQPPLLGAQVEEDLAVVRRRLGRPIADTTPVPPNTALELEMPRCELRQERRKGLERDRLLFRIWKAVKIMFTCVTTGQEIPIVDKGDFRQFSCQEEAMTGMVPPDNLDSDDDTSLSKGSCFVFLALLGL
ncbi:hypothetical protein KY289_016889 [Solanum tuberosum]|nr:hypothetical protein KY284_016686 [Solanum tuberosum]KAH0689531.1 hypothetical protein KY289_016889 [Solanum tuberosum]